MFRSTGFLLAVSLLCIPAFPVLGQTAKQANPSPNPVTPIPAYTAEFKTVNVRTLANGTSITTETKEVRARDSQGRVLFITTRTPPAAGIEITSGSIDNPIENTKITWDSHNKKANVFRLPPQDQRHGCWTSESHHFSIHYGGDAPLRNAGATGATLVGGQVSESSRTEQSREELGTTSIQGLEAKGTRVTTVIPAGKMGNDHPITTIRESWYASGFPFALREISDDPRTGKRTREVLSLTIGEPDLSLFQPPEGYEVVTEEMHEVPCQQ